MNALGPPKKAGGSVNAAHIKATSTAILLPSVATINHVWEREAARLFKEYARTGNPKHLRAFRVHFTAMRAHARRGTQ